MNLESLGPLLAICRLEPDAEIPSWSTRGAFFSISKTAEELTVVCNQDQVPESVKMEKDWRAIKVQGPLEFSLTGILSSIAGPLAAAKISIFAISTFDTDYILIKQYQYEEAIRVLSNAGHSFHFK